MSGTCALVVPWHVSGFGYATGYQAESISSYYQEGVGLPSKQTCTVDTTTMQVHRVVHGQVVPPFVEGATLP